MPTEELFGNYNFKADPVGPSARPAVGAKVFVPRLRFGEVSGFAPTDTDAVVNAVCTKLDELAASLDSRELVVLAALLGAEPGTELDPNAWPGTHTLLDDR